MVAEKLQKQKASEQKERRFRVYAYTLGACATAVVAWDLYFARELVRAELLPVIVFSMFTGCAWYFSLSIYPRASLSVSLDMAYLMTALCVLPHPPPMAAAFGRAILAAHPRLRASRVTHPF